MASLNKVILIGNLGRDPEVRYMPSGEAVANFSIATTDSWKDKSGQRQEKTEWHRIVMYRRLAEIAGEYLKKGSQVYLEGRIEIEEYEKDGVKKQAIKIICHEMKMLGGKEQAAQAPQKDLYEKGNAGKKHYDTLSGADEEDLIPF